MESRLWLWSVQLLGFFWYDKVSEENKPRFLQLLATLYQLYITLQFIPVSPNQDCSYLKKNGTQFELTDSDLELRESFMDE